MSVATLPHQTELPGVILAGGLSRRMGEKKQTVLLGAKPMLDHVIDRLAPQVCPLAINCNDSIPNTKLPCLADSIKDYPGPLAGIAAAMEFARTRTQAHHVLTVPVDTPFLPADLGVELLSAAPSHNTVVLARSRGRLHPVIGLWPVHLEAQIADWLAQPHHRKLMVFLEQLNVIEVDFADVQTAAGPLDPFFNVNTPDDLNLARTYFEALAP